MTVEVTNYPEIRDSLALILDKEVPEKKRKIMDSLDDAVGNNAQQLALTERPGL